MKAFWPEAKGKIHIDAWREVTIFDNFSIEIVAKKAVIEPVSDNLFFINLGGYKENEFEEDQLHIGYLKLDKISL